MNIALAALLTIAAASRSVQPGELVVLTITAPTGGSTAAGVVHARAFNRDLAVFPVDAATWRVLLGIDLDVAAGTYHVNISRGAEKATHDLVVQPKNFRTRRLSVKEAFVTPPPSAAERIAAESKLLAETWKTSAAEPLWTAPFVRPVTEPSNSAFGTRSIFNGKPRNAHGGADFLSPAGTEVHAPNAGRVVIARDLYFSGNTVVIDHGLGVYSMLAHLSAFEVAEGDVVKNGQTIGRVGATGRVTGPHLHWAMRVNDARIDPLSVLAVLGVR